MEPLLVGGVSGLVGAAAGFFAARLGRGAELATGAGTALSPITGAPRSAPDETELRKIIIANGHRLRVYVPFGKEWYAYSMRRLRENPQVSLYIMRAFFGLR